MPKREFTLTPAQTVVIQQAVTITASSVVVEVYDDNNETIEAKLSFKHASGQTLMITLWDANNYPASPPTNTQIRNRIKLLLNLT